MSVPTMRLLLCLMFPMLWVLGCAPDEGTQDLATTAAVLFSVPEGEHSRDQVVELSTPTPDAVIYLSINGEPPVADEAHRYTQPVVVSGDGASVLIQAFAQVPDRQPSALATARYRIRYFEQVGDVVVFPLPGTYPTDQQITLSTPTEGARIYYTLDGSTPTTRSSVYRGAMPLVGDGSSRHIQAIAAKHGMVESDVASATINVRYDVVSMPVMTPVGGVFEGDQLVTLASPDGAVMHFTTDGTDPTKDSPIYHGAIAVRGDETRVTVKAIATAPGKTDSSIAYQSYDIAYTPADAPAIDPPGGSFSTDAVVTLSSERTNATFHFTLDGSEPTTASPRYEGPITVSGPRAEVMLKAIAVEDGKRPSAVLASTYAIHYADVEAVTASPAAGTFSSDQEIVLSTTTPGATIIYSIEDDNGGNEGLIYSGPIAVRGDGANVTIQARALKAGMTPSALTSNKYEVHWVAAPPPVISPNGSSYDEDAPPMITMTSVATNIVIHFTTDGTTPNEASPVYQAPFTLDHSAQVRAFATTAGMLPSAERSEEFRVTQFLHVAADADENSADGSKDAPFASPLTAIIHAQSERGHFQVRVAAGDYEVVDTLPLDSHVSLLGGYDAADWSRDIPANTTTISSTRTESGSMVNIAADADGQTFLEGVTLRLEASGGDQDVVLCDGGEPVLRHNTIETTGVGAGRVVAIRADGSPEVMGNSIRIGAADTAIGLWLTGLNEGKDDPMVYSNTIDTGGDHLDFVYGIAFGDGSHASIVNNTVRFGGAALAVGIGSWKSSTGSAEVSIDNNIVWSDGTLGSRYCIFQQSASHDIVSLGSNNLFECGSGFYRDHASATWTIIEDLSELANAHFNQSFDLTDGANSYFIDEDFDWRLQPGGDIAFEAFKSSGASLLLRLGGEVKDFDGFYRTTESESFGWTPGAFEADN